MKKHRSILQKIWRVFLHINSQKNCETQPKYYEGLSMNRL